MEDLRTNAQTYEDTDSSTPTIDIDALSRERIVAEPGKNFFVEAGAGSGKTTMLVNRMVAMVESDDDIDIDKICAITFTRAAAAEFYDRFQKLLIKRSLPDQSAHSGQLGSLPAPTDKTRKRCRDALQKIDLCFMGTIDSFCQMVLSEHPSEAGIQSNASIVSGDEAAKIYEQEFVNINNGVYGPELQSLSRLFQGIHSKPKEVFLKGLPILMEHRNVHFNITDTTNQNLDFDPDQFFATEKSEILLAAEYLTAHTDLAYQENQSSRDAWRQFSRSYRKVCGSWTESFRNVSSALNSMKNLRLLPQADPDPHSSSFMSWFTFHDGRSQWYEINPDKADQLKRKIKDLRYLISMTFWKKCVPIMETSMRAKGYLTYFDYLYNLRNMLKEDAEKGGNLIRYIADRHRYFLIDEFQDTNPLQAEIFFYLSSVNPKKRWNECVPRPGSLFIVGDPKQSIYRFRSADVSSFERVKKLFEAHDDGNPGIGEVLTLSRNFRSTRTVCEYFNRVMPSHMPGETTVASVNNIPRVKFEEIPLPQPTTDEFEGIFTYVTRLTDNGKTKGEDAGKIADMIEQLVRSKAYSIREEDGKLHPLTYRHFMVIATIKDYLKPIQDELKARNIPVKVEGVVPFTENAALKEISLIFHAVADADDPIALLGALTSSKFVLTHKALLYYKEGGNRFTIKKNARPESGDPVISHIAEQLNTLADLYEHSSSLSPAALFSFIMDQYRIFQTVPAEDMEVVYYAEELIRNAEQNGTILSLKDCVSFLHDLTEGSTEVERCLSLETEKNCVHLANLHKVKGLEAPVVILAEAPEGSFSPKSRITHDDNGSEGYVFSLPGDQSNNWQAYIETSLFDEMKLLETEEIKEEAKRLVYVAATRAKNALILCDSKKLKNNGTEISQSKWIPLIKDDLTDIFKKLQDDENARNQNTAAAASASALSASGSAVASTAPPTEKKASELYDDAEATCALKDRTVETASYQKQSPSYLSETPSKLTEGSGLFDPETDAGETDPSPAAVFDLQIESDSEANRTAESNSMPDEELFSDSISFEEPASDSVILSDMDHAAETKLSDSIDSSSKMIKTQFPNLIGTMVHKLMERMVTAMISSKKPLSDTELEQVVNEIIREYSSPAIESDKDKFQELLLGTAQTMMNGGYPQNNDMSQDLFSELLSADEVYCELPFCYVEKDSTTGTKTIWSGRMDVVYRSGDAWHIVDYKTDADGENLDVKYKNQLDAYTEAFKKFVQENKNSGDVKETHTRDAVDARTYHIIS